ncbi:schlafen family member 11 [Erethizon dorsatum]
MQTNGCSLLVEPSHPDLVINVGKVTLGEENRKRLQKIQRGKEKARILQATCALLNSGGGVIWMEMANEDGHSVEMGLDLEQALRELIQSSDLQAFFEHGQQERRFYIFVKSWSSGPFPEDNSTKPRICSLSSSLYRRSGTSVLLMNSREAFDFLKTQKRNAKHTLINEESPPSKIPRVIHQNISESNPAFQVFQSDKIEYGHILPFPESQSVEFKQFSTKNVQEYVKSIIPEYISAFANSGGGYLFIGVDDKSKRVLGCAKENVDSGSLQRVIAEAISKLPVFHFCSTNAQVPYETKVINVFEKENLYGYLVVVKVEPFCCVVFSEAPISWMVNERKAIYSLTADRWVAMMMDMDPDLAEAFESQLSLSNSPPHCRPVYSRKGLEHKANLQQHLFPVSPGHLQYTPESLWNELSSQHEGLEELISQQIHPASWGILIFSRSWAVDLNLEEKQGVICDALLVAQNRPPTLYTILGEQDAEGQDYCTRTAFTLKQKLVNMGGYTGKVCVMTKVLCLSPNIRAVSLEGSRSQIDYPSSYKLADTQQMEALLQALVIVLLGFRSFLSDQLGCEILNILTARQYEIFSKNLHKNRELFVHGLPGSGKTIVAMKIIEKIRNVFHCEKDRVLYICENLPLRNFIRNKDICHAVTRKTFMNYGFNEIQHIIIDEAQNFRSENGKWYEKAKAITQRDKDCPGILWIFLDYYQTSHLTCSGLPCLSAQFPREELTRVVRNADEIAHYLQRLMEEVRENPPPNIPHGSLIMLQEPRRAEGVPGHLKTVQFRCNHEYKTNCMEMMVSYVVKKCQFFLRNGYSSKDIAVLVSTADEVDMYKDQFLKVMRKRKESQVNSESIFGDYIVVDTVRRFSGLERNIVFGINPRAANPAIFHTFLLCLASRARKHLYILSHSGRNSKIFPPFLHPSFQNKIVLCIG